MSYRSVTIRVVALSAVVLLLTPAGSALAASSPAPSATPQSIPSEVIPPSTAGSGKVTFAAGPGNATSLDSRNSFSYNRIAAGTVIQDFLGVSNFSDQPETFTLGSADAYTNTGGVTTLKEDNQRSTDIGSWITFAHTQVTIPSHARLNEPITITVPSNAKPGDHQGGVFAEYRIGSGSSGSNSFAQDHRVGVPVYISIPGAVVAKLGISSLTTSYNGTVNPIGDGSTTVSYTVTNAGNVNLTGTQNIAITGLYGIPLASVKATKLPELLPGDSYQVKTSVPGVFALSWMTAKVTIQPIQTHPNSAGPAPKIAAATKSAGLWGTPVLLLVIIVAIVVGVVGGRFWFRRRQALAEDRLYDAIEQARRETAEQLTGGA